MQRSRSPFAAHQRKKSPRGYSPRKSPVARGSSPKKGRRSPFACGSSPKRMSPASRSSFAYGSSPKKMFPARRSPFACGSSPKGSRWAVTKSPYKSLFSREPSPRKSPFAVKSMKYHLPACYKGYGNSDDSVCRQTKSEYYNKPCYGPKTKDGRPMYCDPGLDEDPQKPCYWGYRNTIWGDRCEPIPFPDKDGKNPNVRCMGGGPQCLVKPKYKDFKNSVSKTSAECYSGFMHGKGKKDTVCRRIEKATKYSDKPCFGPKGKDGKRPKSCDMTNNLTEKQIDLTNNLSDDDINILANQICKVFKDEDYLNLSVMEKYNALKKTHASELILTPGDDIKLFNKISNTCFTKTILTPTETVAIQEISALPAEKQKEAFEALPPETIEKITEAVEAGGLFAQMSRNPGTTLAAGAVAVATAGAIAYDLLKGENSNIKSVLTGTKNTLEGVPKFIMSFFKSPPQSDQALIAPPPQESTHSPFTPPPPGSTSRMFTATTPLGGTFGLQDTTPLGGTFGLPEWQQR